VPVEPLRPRVVAHASHRARSTTYRRWSSGRCRRRWPSDRVAPHPTDRTARSRIGSSSFSKLLKRGQTAAAASSCGHERKPAALTQFRCPQSCQRNSWRI
jgi:hypothetical protein